MVSRVSLLALPLLALGLQGCVAAVIPLAAAGAMGTSLRDKPDTPVVETRMSNPVVTTPVAEGSLDDPMAEEATELAAPVAEDSGQPGLGRPIAPLATTSSRDAATYAAFADYALDIAMQEPGGDEARPSALLAKPGTLTPDRAPCQFDGNAVLIDLDPMDGELDTASPMARPTLAAALDRLRAEDVEVVWSTSLTADRAGDVREWLRLSELDGTGEDRLLLLRYPEDRKQTRRNEAAQDKCLIAMLGDERADFDELYDYLKDPKAAFGLEKMLGAGWFLAPIQDPAPVRVETTPPAADNAKYNEGSTP